MRKLFFLSVNTFDVTEYMFVILSTHFVTCKSFKLNFISILYCLHFEEVSVFPGNFSPDM